MERKIEVLVKAHDWDNRDKPYFWCILQSTNGGIWCNIASGWETSPLNAFNKAYLEECNLKTEEQSNIELNAILPFGDPVRG